MLASLKRQACSLVWRLAWMSAVGDAFKHACLLGCFQTCVLAWMLSNMRACLQREPRGRVVARAAKGDLVEVPVSVYLPPALVVATIMHKLARISKGTIACLFVIFAEIRLVIEATCDTNIRWSFDRPDRRCLAVHLFPLLNCTRQIHAHTACGLSTRASERDTRKHFSKLSHTRGYNAPSFW